MLELVRDGWIPYGFMPFQEDLGEVLRLVGTADYEVCRRDGMCYIRPRSEA